MAEFIHHLKITRLYRNGGVESLQDSVIEEQRIAFYLNGKKLLSVMSLPREQDAHLVGFLRSEGVLDSVDDIEELSIAPDGLSVSLRARIDEGKLSHLHKEKTLTTGCCVGVSANFEGEITQKFIATPMRLDVGSVFGLIDEFESGGGGELWERTGCVHRAMLVTFEEYSASEAGHSALSDKSAIEPHYFGDRPCVLSPRASAQSPLFSSQILECLAESSPKDSREASESPHSESHNTSESTLSDSHSISESASSVIASNAKQSIKNTIDSESMDCHAGLTPARNDSKTESALHTNLESAQDSEVRAERHALSAIESHSGDKQGLSPALKASSGWGIVKGEGATSQFKPLPLNKKENTESEEVRKTLEMKTADSKAIDLESKNQAEFAGTGDSEKQDLESKNLESVIDSESTPSVIASVAKQSTESKIMDCHEAIASRNDKDLKSTGLKTADFEKIICPAGLAPTHNEKHTESAPHTTLESKADSTKAHISKPAYNKQDSTNKAHPTGLGRTATLISEDVGRHNAIDKVLGRAHLQRLCLRHSVLVVSGRLSMEMVIKAAMSDIPIIISRASTTLLGVKSAQILGVTLIGFARDGRLSIYTHPARITH